jgi:hypothetical protein
MCLLRILRCIYPSVLLLETDQKAPCLAPILLGNQNIGAPLDMDE